ncbi:TPA: HU family DNA-binding protein [Bacillus cereus]|nr:HU family DNA-binding protein [Bacillus cereus]
MLKPEVIVAVQAELKETHEIEASQKTVKAHMDALETVVTGAIAKGEDVKLKGFVDFTTKEVEAREAKNPATGEPVQVPAHRKATASLSKSIRKFEL